MSGSATTVLVEKEGPAALLILHRPEAANALSRALVGDLRAALAALQQPPQPAAVILTGQGDKAFCAGADLRERRSLSLEETRLFLRDLNSLMEEIAGFPRPVLAALNGSAFGGGLELALACDLRLCVEGAQMGLPEVRLGIIPGAGGTQRLSRLCGVAAAKELALTGRRIDAVRALALGLVNAVVPAAALRAEALSWAQEIALCAPLAVAQAKRAIDDGFGRPLAEGLAVERAAYEVVLGSADRDEGLAAFAEKRKPSWRGK
jgi:enoyl-CoA hydratase/carnithine racemase